MSIVIWPDGVSRAAFTASLEPVAGTDRFALRRTVNRDGPSVIGPFDTDVAATTAAHVRAAGGDAFEFTRADLESLGPTWRIRDLWLDPSGIGVDLWRGDGAPLIIDINDVDVLVHAVVSKQERVPGGFRRDMDTEVDWSVQQRSPHVMHVPLRPIDEVVNVSYKLDIHVRSGLVLQVDGDRFAFEVLGDRRGPPDKVNIEQMRDLLHGLSPRAVVDDFFRLFRPPIGTERLDLPRVSPVEEDVTLAFYSRWMALVYRYVRA